jgi:hypothetical protein
MYMQKLSGRFKRGLEDDIKVSLQRQTVEARLEWKYFWIVPNGKLCTSGVESLGYATTAS